MLPGLMRTAATPWSIAFSARLALKWMSAMIGTGEKRAIFESASASSVFGTATRTISHPALASAATCAVVAATSCVFVVVIDWTTTGAPPPIATPPTWICLLLAIPYGILAAQVSDTTGVRHSPLAAAEPADVVRDPDHEQEQDERDADRGDALVDLARDRLPPDRLDHRERDVAAVERQQGQHVHQRERQADQPEHPEVVLCAL